MTDQKLKTLKELADEVGGFPFEAYNHSGLCTFHVTGISPRNETTGWYTDELRLGKAEIWNAQTSCWTLVTPKKKLVEFLYEFPKNEYHTMIKNTEIDAQQFCRNLNATFIKVIRELEI